MRKSIEKWKKQIFGINSSQEFNVLALEIFHFQAGENKVYSRFLELLDINPKTIQDVKDIPFLPIEFFKHHEVISVSFVASVVEKARDARHDLRGEKSHVDSSVSSVNSVVKTFSSSGTTGQQSRHYVADLDLYRDSFRKGFQHFYGDPADYRILGLLPSYLEREGSSLIFMVDDLIRQSGHSESGFYLDQLENLSSLLSDGKKTMLFGVSFALLDLAEQFPQALKNCIIMETGGMKGRRKEMTRNELHETLQKAFPGAEIHSEYGMTELLSQAYCGPDMIFHSPAWMQVRIREVNDPFSHLPAGKTGGIDVIDLANLESCAFISTQDLGKLHPDGGFEVLGRFDYSDLRGCNLLLA